MVTVGGKDWILVKKSNLDFYKDLELYYKSRPQQMSLYKAAGLHYAEVLAKKNYNGQLYIKSEDKLNCLLATHKGFKAQMSELVDQKANHKVKEGLVNLVEDAFTLPSAEGISVLQETMGVMVDSYVNQPDVLKNFVEMSYMDYTTAIHSVNVMALTTNYGFHMRMPIERVVELGLAALLHDIGKIKVPLKFLQAPRKLTAEEFEYVKAHTIKGAEILQRSNTSVHVAIPGALQHHEKIDGSGYPYKAKKISKIGQILSIIDSYEALTNDERLYRSAIKPLEALKLLKRDVDQNRLDRTIFADFAYSLTKQSSEAIRLHYK